ncbi:MAG TPA: adenosylcobalamin-dependent ribonucleoside-diphosphate reductase [Anaeromyxobacteraceae bacterium]|nr:adenosylcobalamin-dependent ribonucleoside-diphosphate reductase [Anaeromyxobacteraceae bacterium]
MTGLTENARTVLARRYLLRDDGGTVVESPGEMFRRVARAVAAAERPADRSPWAERFERRMSALEFLPNSPTLMNAGRPHGQLAACFVLPVADDLEGIFDALKWAALIHQSGGGTGFSFSRLRPRGDLVRTTHGVASGPVSFIRVFDAATETIKQGGVRRGANMAVLRVDHPDVLDFVDAKRGPGLGNFNVSVAVTDAFLAAVDAGAPFPLRHPRDGAVVREVPARELFRRIAEDAWASGEPGLLFLDRVNAANPTPDVGEIEGVNPCGEQPLLPFEACTLGSVNLSLMERGGTVDRERLAGAVRDGVRFLDDVLDVNEWPLPQVAEISRRNRKVGLGVMGWADLLLRLGIPYDDPRALDLAGEVMAFVQAEAHGESRRLAAERGPFPGWATSAPAARGEPPRRNATVTTIAPTGTLSVIAGCSSGIEPLFAVAYVRHALEGAELPEEHPLLAERLRGEGGAAALAAIRAAGRARGVEGVDPEVQRLFATAHDVAPEDHVRMQAAFQRHVDNGVSKTVNLPASAPVEAVERAFRLAHQLGLKGITVYRDGSRAGQVLTSGLPGAPSPANECPACGGTISRNGGCVTCPACGWGTCETTS